MIPKKTSPRYFSSWFYVQFFSKVLESILKKIIDNIILDTLFSFVNVRKILNDIFIASEMVGYAKMTAN